MPVDRGEALSDERRQAIASAAEGIENEYVAGLLGDAAREIDRLRAVNRMLIDAGGAAEAEVDRQAAEIERLRDQLERAALAAIEQANPGIDMDAVRQRRAELHRQADLSRQAAAVDGLTEQPPRLSEKLIEQAKAELSGEELERVIVGLRCIVDEPLTADDIDRGQQIAAGLTEQEDSDRRAFAAGLTCPKCGSYGTCNGGTGDAHVHSCESCGFDGRAAAGDQEGTPE